MAEPAAAGVSRGRRALRAAGWSAAALAAPILAALCCHLLQGAGLLRGTLAETLGVGGLAGMIVGWIAGMRSGLLLGWTLGPPVGFLAGYLDLVVCSWLCAHGWRPFHASLVPVWGLILGLCVSLPRRCTLPILCITLGAAAAQTAANAAWFAFATSSWAKAGGIQSARWLLESIVYAPAALVVVLATPRRAPPLDLPTRPKS